MISSHHRRVLYIKKDTGMSALRTATIMPYLEDREILVSSKDYQPGSIFWTLIDTFDHEKIIPISRTKSLLKEVNGIQE
jgi:hypothetical protein